MRVPGPEIAPSRMRLCDWWNGPRLFILVDDYDMVSGGPVHHPFAPLVDHLALGWEVGMHVIVARSAAVLGDGLGHAESLSRGSFGGWHDHHRNMASLQDTPRHLAHIGHGETVLVGGHHDQIAAQFRGHVDDHL